MLERIQKHIDERDAIIEELGLKIKANEINNEK